MVERRIGSTESATRTKLMDAVEELMIEQGYAALSARKVAEQARLKYQIVFYYFKTMDDLLLATYQRRTQQLSVQVEQAIQSARPLHAIWMSMFKSTDAALSLEYMAMSNHNPAIKAETVEFGERLRRLLAARVSTPLAGSGASSLGVSPIGIAWILNAIICILSFESVLGLSGGHREVIALVEHYLEIVEPSVPAQVTRISGARLKRRKSPGRV
jgi:AcrR family transcriptional regulator